MYKFTVRGCPMEETGSSLENQGWWCGWSFCLPSVSGTSPASGVWGQVAIAHPTSSGQGFADGQCPQSSAGSPSASEAPGNTMAWVYLPSVLCGIWMVFVEVHFNFIQEQWYLKKNFGNCQSLYSYLILGGCFPSGDFAPDLVPHIVMRAPYMRQNSVSFFPNTLSSRAFYWLDTILKHCFYWGINWHILVSGVQHNDTPYLYYTSKWSPQ